MESSQLKQIITVFLILVIGLALTPTVQNMVTDSRYIPITEDFEIEPLVANSTTTTYTARNDSSTYAYFTIVLNDTTADDPADTAIYLGNFTYTVSSKLLTFVDGVLDDGKIYLATVTYYYIAMGAAAISMVDLVPLFYVIALVAVCTVTIIVILKKGGAG
jgi:hypothetical protein